jgi:glucose/arabinose dehydrogenase
MKRILFLLVSMILLVGCGTLSPNSARPTITAPTTETSTGLAHSTPAVLPPATTAASANNVGNAVAFPDSSMYKWTPVVSGLESPTDIQFPDDGSGRMFVLQQPGRIALVRDGQMSQTAFLDLESKVGSGGNEQGLLGLAFHPKVKDNPYFYVNYTDTNGNTVIARFQADGDAADPASEKDLIHVDQPFPNHNGGVLAFGPDGYLYAGLGDGGSADDPFGNGQNKSVLLGKILRVDVDHGDPYLIPADNPFGNEIWDFGLRNPWRFSFDKVTGDLYIGDVGQDTWEEVDVVGAGQGGLDFGWNYREASHVFKGSPPASLKLTYPVDEYSHASGRCSITGGFVYRGSLPAWQGIYFYGDYCSGEIWGMMRTSDPSSKTGWVSQVLFRTGGNITTFGQDPTGEIYYADRAGTIYKLQQ